MKQSVVGYGRAEKSQVQLMVKALLGLKEIPKPDDAADALAVAYVTFTVQIWVESMVVDHYFANDDERSIGCLYIKGSLEEVYPQKVVVEAGGIGYEIKVNQSLLSRLPEKGSMVKLYTYFNVREDAQELYGFLNKRGKGYFRKVNNSIGHWS